ncbi:PREDICTED: uncharacterized protein LOC108766456 [Trachymyrmex cornetzi]|nr:PREDICTED: uncharacterized protein LOC108766456 [Trachymyrmex cornetzi]
MRDRFSMRRHVAEKYYDCLQCAEQCRHVDNSNPSGSGNNNNNYGNNNNGKKDGEAVAVSHRIRGNYHLPTSSAELYLDEEAAPISPDELRRVRSTRGSLSKSLARHQSAHLTPAKKRSSLARPVRVHDSFVQPRRPMAEEDISYQEPQRDQQTCKNPWWWERQDQQEPNTSSYTYHRDTEDGNAGWPIRLRLEQMLELTLPQTKRKKKKKKKTATATMMLMKQQQRGRHGFKDTEKLLKVLSINNVDQDNRYNVKRCSVM